MTGVSNYEELAASIMLRGIKESELLAEWDYRKGKTFSDVRTAVGKGRQKGLGKFEREAMEIGFALERVVKPKTIDRG